MAMNNLISSSNQNYKLIQIANCRSIHWTPCLLTETNLKIISFKEIVQKMIGSLLSPQTCRSTFKKTGSRSETKVLLSSITYLYVFTYKYKYIWVQTLGENFRWHSNLGKLTVPSSLTSWRLSLRWILSLTNLTQLQSWYIYCMLDILTERKRNNALKHLYKLQHYIYEPYMHDKLRTSFLTSLYQGLFKNIAHVWPSSWSLFWARIHDASHPILISDW